MSGYREEDIKHETGNFWVLDVGTKGFEVYQKGATHSTKVASVGHGDGPRLGLTGAIAEAGRRQAGLERRELIESIQRSLKPHGWVGDNDAGGPPTLVATKTYDTAVGPRHVEVWLGDRLRLGNPCVYAQHHFGMGNALDDLWIPVEAFRHQEAVKSFVGLADTMVYDTMMYRTDAVRLAFDKPMPRLMLLRERSDAWRVIFGAQAAVMDPHEESDDSRPRREEISQR